MHMRTISSPTHRTRRSFFALALCLAVSFTAYTSAHAKFLRTQPDVPQSSGKPNNPAINGLVTLVQTPSDQTLWRVDLHSVGYPTGNSQLQWQRGLGSFDTVDFVSNGVVVATFITQEPAAALQRRNDPNRARPYRLHAIFLDAATGTVLKTLDWLGDDLKMGIFPRYDGSFVLFSTDHLVLYSADWKPVKEVAILQLQEPNAILKEIAESPSGKVIEVRIRRDTSLLCLRIQTDTLTAVRDMCSALLGFSVSDDELAMSDARQAFNLSGENREGHPQVNFHGGPQPHNQAPFAKIEVTAEREDRRGILCDSDSVVSCAVPAFINNDMIVVHNNSSLGLFDISGIANHEKAKLEFQRYFGRTPAPGPAPNPEYDWVAGVGRPVRAAANGQRFVVALNAPVAPEDQSAANALFPELLPAAFPDHVDVFDLPSGLQSRLPELQCQKPDGPCDWWIYRIINTKKQFKQIWGLGLSPNGEKLVIDSGGVIQTYTLPPETASAEPKH
jgi:hypothetical protein